jgi:Ca-activated chloride channel family protein
MKFAEIVWIWPQMLWLLCLLPMMVTIYVRRRRKIAATSSSIPWLVAVGKVQQASYGSAVLLLLGLVMMTLATARPQAVILVPQRVDAVMLVLDTSGSMRADDVLPSRIEAAKEAIRGFIERQPASMKVGLVSVAATAVVTQMPTTDREALLSALDGIALQRGSALGAGIAVALAAVLPPGTVPSNRFSTVSTKSRRPLRQRPRPETASPS